MKTWTWEFLIFNVDVNVTWPESPRELLTNVLALRYREGLEFSIGLLGFGLNVGLLLSC